MSTNVFDNLVVLEATEGLIVFRDFATGVDALFFFFYPGNPNGIVPAPKGSIASGPAGAFINTDGAVAWAVLGGGGGGGSLQNAYDFTPSGAITTSLAGGPVAVANPLAAGQTAFTVVQNAPGQLAVDVTGSARFTTDLTARDLQLADPTLGTSLFIDSAAGEAAAVSAANHGRIRYNSVTQTWQASMNGAPYIDITVGGGGGTASILKVPFTFASGTLVLFALAPGMIVSPCYVRVTTPWDVVGGTLQVGTPSNPTALLPPADVNLLITARYDAQFDFQATLVENLQLVIGGTPATAGAGYVLFTVG